MQISVEISYYPLEVKYLNPIQTFIDKLNTYEEIETITNGMSTQIFGNYSEVMKILTKEIENAFELPNSIFVLKIINLNLK